MKILNHSYRCFWIHRFFFCSSVASDTFICCRIDIWILSSFTVSIQLKPPSSLHSASAMLVTLSRPLIEPCLCLCDLNCLIWLSTAAHSSCIIFVVVVIVWVPQTIHWTHHRVVDDVVTVSSFAAVCLRVVKVVKVMLSKAATGSFDEVTDHHYLSVTAPELNETSSASQKPSLMICFRNIQVQTSA